MHQKQHAILYVDDSVLNLTLFKASFSDEYDIVVCQSGNEGLKILSEQKISVIIADFKMPVMDGVEFLHRSSKIKPIVPRILLTAYGSFDNIQEAVNKAKIFRFIKKPWKKSEVKNVIESAIDIYNVRNKNIELSKKLQNNNIRLKKELKEKELLLKQLSESESFYKKSQDYLRNIMNTTNLVIFVLSADFKILEWNDEGQKYFSNFPENFFLVEFLNFSAISDEKSMYEYYLQKSIKDRKSISFEGKLFYKTQRVSFYWNTSPFFEDGNVIGVILTGQNIEELKVAQKQKRESLRLYRLLTENAYDVIWTMGSDLVLTYMSPSVERLYNYTPTELIGHKFEELVEARKYHDIKSRIEKFLLGINNGNIDKEAITFDTKIVGKDGGEVWSEMLINKVFDENNNFLFFSGVMRDISQKKHAEIKTKQSEQKFSKLFHASPDCMLLVNLKTDIVIDANQIFFISNKLEKKDVVGRKLQKIGFWPSLKVQEDVLNDLETKGEVRNFELIFQQGDRRKVGLLAIEKMIIDNESHALFIIKDITERKSWEDALTKSEEKFRTIFENSVVGYYRVSVDGDLLLANSALIKMLGFTSIDDYKQHNLYLKEMRNKFQKKVCQEEIIIDRENAWIKKDGITIYVSESAKAVRNLNGEIVYFDGTVVDITERINSEKALKSSEQRLREAQKLAHIGHWVYDNVNGTIEWSEEVYRILGLEAQEKELSFNKAFEFVDPNLRDEIFKNLQEAIKQKKEFTGSCKVFSEDKTPRTIKLSVRSNYNEQGEPVKTLGTIQDITEIKQAEEKIKKLNEELELKVFNRTLKFRQSERKFRQLLKYIPDGIILVDSELRIVLVNEQTQNIFDYKRSELIKKDARIVILEKSWEVFLSYFQETLEKHDKKWRNTGIDIYGKKKDGTKFPIDVRLGIVYIDDKFHVICIIRDITIRKRNENELRKLTQSLTQHPGSIVITDKEGIIEYINPNFEKVTGYSKDEVLGNTPRILKADGMPDSFYKELWQTITQKKVWHGDFLNKRKNGEVYWERASIAPILNKDKEITNFVSVKYEITEAKKNEEHLKFATYTIENAGDSIYWVDVKTGTLVFVNKAGYESLGYTMSELLKLKYYQVDQKTTKQQWEKLRLKLLDQKYIQFDTNLLKKNKESLSVQMTASLVEYKGTNYIIVFAQDVSKKREAENQLKNATALAESASRTKSEFIANMSHEIRTPLNAVLGITELLLLQITDDLQRNYLKTIKSSGRSLLRIINDILDISKIEAGKMTISFNMFDIREMIDELEQMFSVKANEKGVALKVAIDPELPDFVSMDDLRLRQILVNLLSNAIKFTSAGYVMLRIKVLKTDNKQEGEIGLIIEVEDTGIGIEEEFKSKAFEEFSQQEGQDSKKFEGSGLGLAISKRLVELIGGRISVMSKKGEGTKFTIELKSVKHSNHAQTKDIDLSMPIRKQNFLHSKVLIVDDVEESRQYIQGVFKGMKVDTYLADNGKTAYELALKIKPNLVITDIMMPVMDGFELSKKIRETPELKDTKIIANSAAVLTISEKHIQSASIDEFLVKPVVLDKLYQCLKEYLPYDEFYESTIETEKVEGIDKGMPPEAIIELKNKAYPLWSRLQEHQKMNDVQNFSEIIKEIGDLYENKVLLDYSKELLKALKAFDIYSILRLLKHFKMFIEP